MCVLQKLANAHNKNSDIIPLHRHITEKAIPQFESFTTGDVIFGSPSSEDTAGEAWNGKIYILEGMDIEDTIMNIAHESFHIQNGSLFGVLDDINGKTSRINMSMKTTIDGLKRITFGFHACCTKNKNLGQVPISNWDLLLNSCGIKTRDCSDAYPSGSYNDFGIVTEKNKSEMLPVLESKCKCSK